MRRTSSSRSSTGTAISPCCRNSSHSTDGRLSHVPTLVEGVFGFCGVASLPALQPGALHRQAAVQEVLRGSRAAHAGDVGQRRRGRARFHPEALARLVRCTACGAFSRRTALVSERRTGGRGRGHSLRRGIHSRHDPQGMVLGQPPLLRTCGAVPRRHRRNRRARHRRARQSPSEDRDRTLGWIERTGQTSRPARPTKAWQ